MQKTEIHSEHPTRREFTQGALSLASLTALGEWSEAYAAGTKDPLVGKRYPKWTRGELQVHFLYAGSSESIFFIMPDGTTMLVDCGDYDCGGHWECENPKAVMKGMGPGEFVARYILNVNPAGKDVDYWMLTHWHADHGGCETSYSKREIRDGGIWLKSGLAELIDYIDFAKGFDRCWPNMGDPFACADTPVRQFAQIARTYRYLERKKGLKIEKFRVGSDDQIRLCKDPAAFPDFRIRNICGNGIIRTRDGGTKNLYQDFVPKDDKDVWRRENGLSLGFLAEYGDFKLYTAGDFHDFWKNGDGTTFQVEDVLAAEMDRVDVAKTNHHASDSMTPALVKALAARVWVTNSVSVYSDWHTSMRRLVDRSIYGDDRIVCSTYYHLKERIKEMGEADARRDVAKASFEPGHIVVNVPTGGRDYSVTYLAGDADSLMVRSVMRFKSVRKG